MNLLEQCLNQLEPEKAQSFRKFYEESEAFRFLIDVIDENADNKEALEWFGKIISSAKRRKLEREDLQCGT